jgi:small subunit ribosomal protein S8
MVTDRLSDFLTRVRNGYNAGIGELEVPATKVIVGVAKVLAETGYVKGVSVKDGKMVVELKYQGKSPAISGITRISKSGARIYCGAKKFPRVLGGLGLNIVTTPSGIMTDKKAKKLNMGGEIIARVW